MLALEARRMGVHTCVLDPDQRCSAGQVADEHLVASFSDREAAREFAGRTDVVTYEFEHIDASLVAEVEALRPVHPSSSLLKMVQHRVRQKQGLQDLGIPLAAFRPVDTWQDMEQAVHTLGLPAVLKTATSGYDGKGQAVLHRAADAESSFQALRGRSEMLVLEEFVQLEKELSVVCARDVHGKMACYPAVENIHVNGILDLTLAPARVSPALAAAAQELAGSIAQKLGVVGLLCVEMFLAKDGRLLVNELAPRPHNSGHHTLDACPTSQFEQLLRILCRLPLGVTELTTPAVMANLLGDLWVSADGGLDFAAALAVPGVKLHLYNKHGVYPGRKMGHLCAVAPTLETALSRALAARAALTGPKSLGSGDSGYTDTPVRTAAERTEHRS
ncbi:MAG: 5-(carboxyamino)imidazole ribonucleotide synthase [Dehalococcoidia bacterium]|nr:5-(carboxyamino)imidazole ribonucleotide synthase [Dehalococcoidia bacterium]MSQ16447.1 5-(carboxyamino)imidazole ribonucleotide synthase [Dehalococcoidia bacterium]